MSSDLRISEAYCAAVEAIVAAAGVKPLPPGITTVEAGDWTLSVNNSRVPVTVQPGRDPIGPWTVLAEHKRFFVIAMLDPTGGAVGGGMSEAEFIADMKGLAA